MAKLKIYARGALEIADVLKSAFYSSQQLRATGCRSDGRLFEVRIAEVSAKKTSTKEGINR